MVTQKHGFDFSHIHERFLKIIELNCHSGFKFFKKILRSHLLFHVCSLSVLVCTALCVFLFSAPLQNLTLLPIFISLLTLSTFTYFALIFYFQSKKNDQIQHLVTWFVSISKKAIGSEFSYLEHYLSVAGGLYHFAHSVSVKSMPLYNKTYALPSLKKISKKLAIWIYAKDFYKLKEFLMIECIKEHLELLRYEPTHLEVHGSLANSYLALAKIYKQSNILESSDQFAFDALSENIKVKFINSLNHAIEEYQILSAELPDDPWVLMQLGICFHELKDYENEIICFEKILETSENNHAVMVRLAKLYFAQKKHSHGFKLYKMLRDQEVEGIDELIDNYIESALD